MKKSQAALEFLMTYGWAFLIIVVIIAGFVYLGVLRPDQYVSERCVTSSGFNCEEFTIRQVGDSNDYELVTNVKNLNSAKINLTDVISVRSDLCPDGICEIESVVWESQSLPVGADSDVTTTIKTQNGLPSQEKILFDMEFRYTEERKDFPKEFTLELFTEVN